MSRNKKIVFLWIAFQLIASALFAEPITGCVTDFGGERYYTITFATHAESGIWTQYAGCDPSGERARPTAGPMKVDYLENGGETYTFDFCEFEANKSSQVDMRFASATGYSDYFDFILNKGDQPEWCSKPPAPECLQCGTDQHSNPTPVPEPASMILMGSGLLYVMRRRYGKN